MTTATVELEINLSSLLGASATTNRQALETFAVLNLGLIESLRSGTINANEGVSRFYNAGNCIYVHKKIKNAVCDEIMSRGVQLPDLFDILAPSAARRQFSNELDAMGRLCLKLLRSVQRKRNSSLSRSKRRRTG